MEFFVFKKQIIYYNGNIIFYLWHRDSYLTARFECLCSFEAWINPSIHSVQYVLLTFPSWYILAETRRENLSSMNEKFIWNICRIFVHGLIRHVDKVLFTCSSNNVANCHRKIGSTFQKPFQPICEFYLVLYLFLLVNNG